ncbi:helix-turn-helix transcriptional regulator [Brackiella oedipodis]|uniref:helix-turn-helix transcriptional regulator n=1 Tax=Brackiella oedipodis TaxID=124225 RepID=UPI00056E9A43|nr:helix-turn-helix transcriptional regulator [Brackiella oedipodis]
MNQIRVENLRYLVKNAGSIARLARLFHGLDATYISQLLNNHRNFGEKAARKMEQLIGLPTGWFDKNHQSPHATGHSAQNGKSWPFESISALDYQKLSSIDKKEIEAIIRIKLRKYTY